MEKITVTCPFTGLPFEAIKYADGRLVTTNKVTGKDMQITYNASNNRYMFLASELKFHALLTMDECAEELGISKPRISKLVKQNRLKAIKPDAQLYITRASMLEFKQQRAERNERLENGARTD